MWATPKYYESWLRHERRFQPHEGHTQLRSFTRHVRHSGTHEVYHDGFANRVRHVRHFCLHESFRASFQARYAMCVASRLIGLRRLPDGETAATRQLNLQCASTFKRICFNLPLHRTRSRGGKWRARPGSGGGRGWDNDGLSKNALLAPRAFTDAEKKKTHSAHARTPSLTFPRV